MKRRIKKISILYILYVFSFGIFILTSIAPLYVLTKHTNSSDFFNTFIELKRFYIVPLVALIIAIILFSRIRKIKKENLTYPPDLDKFGKLK